MKYLTTRIHRPFGLFDEMNRFFNRFHEVDLAPVDFDVDMTETKDSYVITGNLPGFKADDVDLRVEEDLLVIEANIKEDVEKISDSTTWHYRERRRGSMRRSIVLPDKIDKNRVDATIKDGVLSVTLYKRAESTPISITVKSE